MKLKLLLFIGFLFACVFAWGQPAASYVFSSKDIGYAEISNATQLGANLDSTLLNQTMLVGDTGYFNETGGLQKFKAIPLPFNFNLGGKLCTHFLVAANGIVYVGNDSINGAFAPEIAGNYSGNLDNSLVCLTQGYSQVVAALPKGGAKTTSISYGTKMEDGITSLIIQWKNLLYKSAPNVKVFDTLSFQIVINSNHSFDIHFDQYKLSEGSTSAAQIGLRVSLTVSLTDLHLRGSKTSWDNTTPFINGSKWNAPKTIPLSNTIFPPSGRMYTFTPPPACVAPLQASAPTITNVRTDAAELILGEAVETDAILLVLSLKDAAAFTPVDSVIYKQDESINGSLILSSDFKEQELFFDQLEGSTEYTLSVFNYNYLCSGGSKYSVAQTVDFTTRLSEPSLTKTGQNTISVSLNVKANKDNDPIILCKVGSNLIEEVVVISKDVKVGDTLNTGDIVVYKGLALENHIIKGFEPNTAVQFKVYSYRETPSFTFSTRANEVWARTASTPLPIRWDMVSFPIFEEMSSVPGFSTLLSNPFNNYRFLLTTNQFGVVTGDGKFEAKTNSDHRIQELSHDSTDLILPGVLLESGEHRILFEKAFLVPPQFWGDPAPYRLISGDSLCVQISLSDTLNSSFKTIHTVNHINYTDNTINFSKTAAPFSGYNNQIVYFRFVFHSAGMVISRLTNFKIESIKDCDYASSVGGSNDSSSTNTILVRWTDTEEDASAWELQYKEVNTEDWSTPLKVEQNPFRITNLTSNTNYLVRVRTLCSSTSVSDWSEPSTPIKTAYAIPFFCNFDIVDGYAEFLPRGFSNYMSVDGAFLKNTPSSITSLTAAYSYEAWGRQSWKSSMLNYPSIYAEFTEKAVKLITLPNLEFKTDGKSKYMSFSISMNDIYNPGLSVSLDNNSIRVSVLAIKDLENIQFSDTLMTFGKGSSQNLNAMDSVFVKMDLSHLAGDIKIGFLVENAGTGAGAGVYITNVEIDYNCSAPSKLKVSKISDTNAQISWESPKTSNFLVAHKKASETDYMYSKISEQTILLPNLAPSTLYDVKIASLCSDMDTSLFVSTSFSTLAAYVCDTVTNMQVKIQTDNATISWNGSGVKYKVIWKKVSASQWDTIETIENKIDLSNLEEGTQYEYSILSQCSADPSDFSLFTQALRFRTLYITCHVPTNFKLVRLEWNTAGFSFTTTDAQKVELFFGIKGAESGVNYTFGLYDTISLEGLSPETAYVVKLRANCGGTDVSLYTDSIVFTTPAIPVCAPPSQLESSIDKENKKAELSWSGAGHIAWNLVYKEGNTAWDTLLIEKASYQLPNLKENTPYVWKVQGFCSKYLASRYSSQASFQMEVSLEKLQSDLNDFTVYTQKKHIYINNPKINRIDKIEIYNVQGKLLQSHIINSNGNVILPVELNNAFVIINVHSQERIYTYKTIIQ